MERKTLKKSGVLRETIEARFASIRAENLLYDVPMMCRVLDVSKSDYYAWKRRGLSRPYTS